MCHAIVLERSWDSCNNNQKKKKFAYVVDKGASKFILTVRKKRRSIGNCKALHFHPKIYSFCFATYLSTTSAPLFCSLSLKKSHSPFVFLLSIFLASFSVYFLIFFTFAVYISFKSAIYFTWDVMASVLLSVPVPVSVSHCFHFVSHHYHKISLSLSTHTLHIYI